jgi:hypothetical protein
MPFVCAKPGFGWHEYDVYLIHAIVERAPVKLEYIVGDKSTLSHEINDFVNQRRTLINLDQRHFDNHGLRCPERRFPPFEHLELVALNVDFDEVWSREVVEKRIEGLGSLLQAQALDGTILLENRRAGLHHMELNLYAVFLAEQRMDDAPPNILRNLL